MKNIKLGDQVYEGVETVRLDTAEGGTVDYAPYEETFAAGRVEGYNAGKEAGLEEGFDNGKAAGIEEGIQSEYDRFWDVYQENGDRKNYRYAFQQYWWNDENFKPKYDIVPSQDGQYIFQRCGVTDMKAILERQGVALDFSNTPSLYYCFHSSAVTHLPVLNCSKSTNNQNMFNGCESLVSIDKLILTTKARGDFLANIFRICSSLEHVIFEGDIGGSIDLHWSPLLSAASVQSILDHLVDLSGEEAQTLTLHADVGARLTEEQKAVITAKNWTLVY